MIASGSSLGIQLYIMIACGGSVDIQLYIMIACGGSLGNSNILAIYYDSMGVL